MTVGTFVKLFACAIVFAVWALFAALGWSQGGLTTVAFLVAAAVAFAVAELERMRQRRR